MQRRKVVLCLVCECVYVCMHDCTHGKLAFVQFTTNSADKRLAGKAVVCAWREYQKDLLCSEVACSFKDIASFMQVREIEHKQINTGWTAVCPLISD